MSEPVIVNDPKGMGAFLLASYEMENVKTQAVGKGKTVLLDRYFNSEKKKDATGAIFTGIMRGKKEAMVAFIL